MEINSLELWRELVNDNLRNANGNHNQRYMRHARQKQLRPDPLLDFVLKEVDSQTTVLDIGAGTGRWSIPLAGRAGSVTAIEPDGDMVEVLQENLKTAGVDIRIVQSTWEDADVKAHDIVVCAHAMYSSTDFALFVRKMEQCAGKTCYLAIRLPPVNGIIGELCRAVWGRQHDSVNAVVAYNALYSLGIYPNLLMENEIYRWTSNTLEEAFTRAKRHLHLESNAAYDELIRNTLRERLTPTENGYIWPDGMRSALLWWNPSAIAKSVET